MATFSCPTASIVVLLLLSAGAIIIAGGAPPTPTGFENAVKAACDGTPDPATCFIVLSPSANASNTANECALALLAAERATDLLYRASKKIDALTAKMSDTEKNMLEYLPCISECPRKLNNAFMELSGKDFFDDREDEKVTISLVRSFVADAKAKHLVWSCDGCRSLALRNNRQLKNVAKGSKMDKFMEVLYVLVERVPAGKDC